MMLQWTGIIFAHYAACDRNPCVLHGITVARDQIVPVRQLLIIGSQAISACAGQPGDIIHDLER